MEAYKTNDSENSSTSSDYPDDVIELPNPLTDDECDSDETFCELGEIPTIQYEFQNVFNDLENGEETAIREQLIGFIENELEVNNTEEQLSSEHFYCNNDTEEFQFTETALFDEQYLKNSGSMDIFLTSKGLNVSTNEEEVEAQPIDVKNNSMSLGDSLLEGLTENLQGIIGSNDLQSFLENYSPDEVVKPCSPPLTLNRPSHRKGSPATKEELTMSEQKKIQIRISSSPYTKPKKTSFGQEKLREKDIDVPKDTSPERKCSTSTNLETRTRRKLCHKTVNRSFKHNKTTDFKPLRQLRKRKGEEFTQNIEMYRKTDNQKSLLELSKHEMKRKRISRKNESSNLKMSFHQIEEKLGKITTKANLWLNGTGYHPSRDEAFKMLGDAKILISQLETFQKKSFVGRRKPSHKIKEDLLLEAANKLATAINIAIEESDHLLHSELSEIISKDERMDVSQNASRNYEEECTSEGFKLRSGETFDLKPILKYNKKSTEGSESIKKHISFSEDLEECHYISGESNSSEHSSNNSNQIVCEENSESILENEGKSQEENADVTEQNVISSTLLTDTFTQQSTDVTFKSGEEYATLPKTNPLRQSTNKQNYKRPHLSLDDKKEKLELEQVKSHSSPKYLCLGYKSASQLLRAENCSDQQNNNVNTNSEECNTQKGEHDLEGINIYKEEISVSETVLSPNIRSVPPFLHIDGKSNNHIEEEMCNSGKMENSSIIDDSETNDNNSVVFTEERLLKEPEPWTKINIMSVKAVRVKDPSDYIPIKNIPKEMIDSVDWFFN